MVPKIVAKGRSFKGAAAYLLHDKGHADTAERVQWVETRNLATENPELAWRIMVSTALDQDRLKEAAGVRKTGRKSDQPVLHMVLSWHPDERDGLSQDEMRRAAIGALKSIGADDRQVLLIAHNDEEHAHLHVLCNRVSPVDGRMLSSSKDRLKLSKWAQGYELERGKVYCENRVVNNERRAQGEFVVDGTALPYHQAANDRHEPDPGRARSYQAIKESQKAKDRILVERGVMLARQHKEAWTTLSERLSQRRADIRSELRKGVQAARAEIGRAYHPLRLAQNERHSAGRSEFEAREERLIGKITNAMKAIDHVRRVRGEDDPSNAIAQGFKVLASAGARREALAAAQEKEKTDLNRQQTKDVQASKARLVVEARASRSQALSAHDADRMLLVQKHEAENDALRAAWRGRTQERASAWNAYFAAAALDGQMRRDFNEASGSAERRGAASGSARDDLFEELRKELREDNASLGVERDQDDEFDRD